MKKVFEALEVLDGVTKGPWREDGPTWNKIVWSDADNRVCFMAHSNGLNDYRDEATARFIAASRQLVPKMADCIEALQAEVREMALQYLATAGQAQEALEQVERLRDALNQIASEFGLIPNGHRAADIARAALKGEKS